MFHESESSRTAPSQRLRANGGRARPRAVTKILLADDRGLHEAEAVLRAGGVVGFPGDAWYGLAADPWNAAAVGEVYRLKQRPADSPISILAANLGAAADVIAPSSDEFDIHGRTLDGPAAQLAAKFWPGALTLIVSAHPKLPVSVTAGRGVVGVRVSASAVATRLARSVGVITATSANLHGEAPATTAAEVAERFPELALVLDGGTISGGAPSTIVDVTRIPPRLVREGSLSRGALARVIPGIQ